MRVSPPHHSDEFPVPNGAVSGFGARNFPGAGLDAQEVDRQSQNQLTS